MKRCLLLFFAVVFYLSVLIAPQKIRAIVDPMSSQNNKFGVHILFTTELEDAAKLINSSGGDWGYVTIPIQAGDKDLVKWQGFMDSAKQNHVIPIIRLATEGDYFTNSIWRKPNFADVLDFANFLNSLDWPTLNRYVVIFNEPNRSDEWGGEASASEYARILSYAVETFKSKNSDFFIISAGFDNASENIEGISKNEYTFMQEMANATPEIFNMIDAIASHSYPNPGFKQPPWVLTRKTISSFVYEKRLADFLGNKNLPVFITETGWSNDSVSQGQIASYFEEAFEKVWSADNIVAVTPFLLNAGTIPFAQFSLINENGAQNEGYKAIVEISKIKGNPDVGLAKVENFASKNAVLPIIDFSDFYHFYNESTAKDRAVTAAEFVKWLFRI